MQIKIKLKIIINTKNKSDIFTLQVKFLDFLDLITRNSY